MFGSKDKSHAPETAPVQNKSASSKDIKTLIGEGCKVEGNFFIPTATRIDGTIKGDLTGDSGIVIGLAGRIEGSICASEVVVYGTVEGNIETNKLELKKGSKVNGDLTVNNFITEQGSIFNGKCIMKTEESNVTELKTSADNYGTGNVKIKSAINQ
ncbi:MAG: polymer-forming cytoskeletal protein [Ignavibacteria bacterium]|nr:polymer-forming cytoskeletal protein [Ignavibacteria bacterium]